ACERVANDPFGVGAYHGVERARARCDVRLAVDRLLAARAPPRFAAEVARDGAQPRPERSSAHAIQPAPRCYERLLRHVLAEGAIARRAVGHCADDVLVARDQLPEGIELAAPAGLDELVVSARDRSHVAPRYPRRGQT